MRTLARAYPPAGGWSTDDLDRLPEDLRRRELIDGILIMQPPVTTEHQCIAMRLFAALAASCPDYLAVTQAVEVRVSRRRSFIPDLLVTTIDAAAKNPSKFSPHEVILVIEIVSPGSRTLDRLTKPALYAEAEIPYFWRVETEGTIDVTTYRLDPQKEVYAETGMFTTLVDIDEPWPITVPIAQLRPRTGR